MGRSVVYNTTSSAQTCAVGESTTSKLEQKIRIIRSDVIFFFHLKALGISTAVLILLWESKGITIASLTKGSINYRNELNGFVGISLLTVLYSIGMAILGISGLNLPPFLVCNTV